LADADFACVASAKKTHLLAAHVGGLAAANGCRIVGDSVAGIFQAMGLEHAGAHGTTAALAMLNDAVKKG
jgi:hypothetical protein